MDDPRVVLMMQGPMSPFFAHLRDRLVARGARVVKVQICPADALLWRRPGAVWFRGRWEEFAAWIADLIAREGVTDLVLWGDQRTLHRTAIDAALAAGVKVHALELGYLRPDWLTVEPDGLASASRMPRDPCGLRALGEGRPQPSTDRLARGSFLVETLYDIVFNVSNVLAAPLLFPHYRRHAMQHPFREYAGWIGKFARAGKVVRARTETLARWSADPRPLFLMPLQLSTDFQIRAHSPFPTLVEAVDWILASFARHAPADARLLFKIHPLDNGLDRWDILVPARAEALGVGPRVAVIDGGDLDAILAGAAGVVTVNSTVGMTALDAGVSVVVLGNAVFDVPGLTHQGPLATFWTAAVAPDADLVRTFRAAIAHAAQVRGGVITAAQIAIGAEAAAERILEREQRLPTGGPAPRPAPVFPRLAEWKSEMSTP
ncbi:MAG TPA: capsular biosynthesis protein [Methylomirabilota bacterium]|nr:capsular biosynthesis protein [Methylomirabilota bacterium]